MSPWVGWLVGWLVAQVDFLLVGFVSPRVGFGWRRLSVGDLEEVTGEEATDERREDERIMIRILTDDADRVLKEREKEEKKISRVLP